jgi:4-carboxymuconolactone decarboxylase
MRFKFLCAGVLGLAGVAQAQAPAVAPAKPPAPLRGDRFKPLTYEQLTPPQKGVADLILSGKIEGGTAGPYNVMLRSPELAESLLRYGAYVRFHSPLPVKLSELSVLLVTRYWTSQFPWTAHHRAAAQAGLSEAIITAIAEGRRPASMQPDEQVVYDFAAELLKTTQMSDATFIAAKEKLGERGVVDLMGVMGYFQIVSMMLNIDRYPLPDGAQPELKPLANPIP